MGDKFTQLTDFFIYINHYKQEGNLLDENGELEQLSLIDAVLPDTFATKQAVMADRALRQESSSINIKSEILNDEGYSLVNSAGNSEGMDVDGHSNDSYNNNKSLLLRGHKSEVIYVPLV